MIRVLLIRCEFCYAASQEHPGRAKSDGGRLENMDVCRLALPRPYKIGQAATGSLPGTV